MRQINDNHKFKVEKIIPMCKEYSHITGSVFQINCGSNKGSDANLGKQIGIIFLFSSYSISQHIDFQVEEKNIFQSIFSLQVSCHDNFSQRKLKWVFCVHQELKNYKSIWMNFISAQKKFHLQPSIVSTAVSKFVDIYIGWDGSAFSIFPDLFFGKVIALGITTSAKKEILQRCNF